MSILFNDAASEYIASGTPITTYPVTMACWFNSDTSSPTNQTLMSLGQSTSDSNCLRIRDPADSDVIVVSYDGSTSFAASGGTWSTNTWHHAAGVFAASNSRTAYLDGSGGSTDTGNRSITMAGIELARMQFTTRFYLSGMLAHVGLWDVALSSAEISILAAGASPLQVRPQNLRWYAPLHAETHATDYFGQTLTSFNTPSAGTSNPRVVVPFEAITTPAGGAGVAPPNGGVFKSSVFGEAA